MSKRPKLLITGGAGYIGSHTIVEILETTGYDVVSIDNLSNASENVFENIFQITGKKVRNYNIDLCDMEKLRAFFETEKDISGVIHFAALKSVPESVSFPYLYYHNNINSLLNLLECCKDNEISNFIFSSSCSVYGNISELPVKESTALGKAESPYAYTKQAGEEMLKDFAKAYPWMRLTALRYFNPVGAHPSARIGESPLNRPNNLVPIITANAIGKMSGLTVYGGDYPTRDGTCIRDYVHVSDIATAHVRAYEHLTKQQGGKNFYIFNLGTGSGVSVLEAIHAFEKVSGKKLKYTIGPKRPGDVVAIYSDCSLSEKELGWSTKFSLDEMMETAWAWEQNSAR
jgi:UDP-glucose 4-epimerase